MVPDRQRILVSREQIAARVRAMGKQIASDLDGAADGQVILIPIMTGALVFAADLIREMPVKLSLRLVAVSSYPGTSMASKGAKIAGEIPRDLEGKHVLVVDDILDSGQTLALVRSLIEEQKPASVRICVLLKKPETARVRPVSVEYVGFEIPDEFVVGYGLDFDGFYRNLPHIAALPKPAAPHP